MPRHSRDHEPLQSELLLRRRELLGLLGRSTVKSVSEESDRDDSRLISVSQALARTKSPPALNSSTQASRRDPSWRLPPPSAQLAQKHRLPASIGNAIVGGVAVWPPVGQMLMQTETATGGAEYGNAVLLVLAGILAGVGISWLARNFLARWHPPEEEAASELVKEDKALLVQAKAGLQVPHQGQRNLKLEQRVSRYSSVPGSGLAVQNLSSSSKGSRTHNFDEELSRRRALVDEQSVAYENKPMASTASQSAGSRRNSIGSNPHLHTVKEDVPKDTR